MIIIFHLLSSILHNVFKNRTKDRIPSWKNFNITAPNSCYHPLAQRDAENDVKFDPPVYKQRYERASEILMEEKWKHQMLKVVDFGCAEFGLFVFLKNTLEIREISFVDIDELLLRDCLYRLYPLNADYLVRREKSLGVKVFAGSVADPDPSLLGTDAIVAIEIIEHLYPDVLQALPYNFFSYIRPKLVIITTPNSEFNILFEKVFKFRHDDHKFEWTREQFESWATNITERFPSYTVRFDGVGLGPTESENVGCCSQLAVFIRKDIICDNYIDDICSTNYPNDAPQCSYGICTYYSHSQKLSYEDSYYKLIANIEYPRNVDTRTEEEKILDELKYRIHLFRHNNEDLFNFDLNRIEVPLNQIIYLTTGPFPSESEVRALLLKFNYQIEECLNRDSNQFETCVIYEPEMESGSGSDTEGYESDNKFNADDPQLSDWDEKDLTWSKSTSKEEASTANGKTDLHLQVGSSKKYQGALFDSGYQKSPSVPDESPQSNKEAMALDYKSLNETPNRFTNILSVFENFDKINELDAFPKDKKYYNFPSNLPHREVMKKICQEIGKHPVAGPSRDTRKSKSKKSNSSDSDESVDDVKSITTCILENSLNRIECKDEEQIPDLIQLIPELPQENENPILEPAEPVLVVENGDLANNNRDLEGNNYPPEDEENQLQDDNIDNLQLEHNINIDNNNDLPAADLIELPVVEIIEEMELPPIVEVAWSSREALFDVNSEIDLLEDFEMDAAVAVVNEVVFPNNIVTISESSSTSEAVLPPEETGFPNWLLQIFEEGEFVVPEDDLHDEPHFYCQGDGLGVHPSTVAINDNDDDDEGNESGSDSSSSSGGSVDFANAENQSLQEMFMTPDNSRNDNLVLVGQPLPAVDESSTTESQEQEEVFENAEESESNLVTTSCSQ